MTTNHVIPVFPDNWSEVFGNWHFQKKRDVFVPRKKKICVPTSRWNLHIDMVYTFLARLSLIYFRTFLLYFTSRGPKPDPPIFKKTCFNLFEWNQFCRKIGLNSNWLKGVFWNGVAQVWDPFWVSLMNTFVPLTIPIFNFFFFFKSKFLSLDCRF